MSTAHDWQRHHGREEQISEYERRLVAERMADADFRAALGHARAAHGANVRRAELDRGDGPLIVKGPVVTRTFLERWGLNRGWVMWLYHYMDTGENEPGKIQLWDYREKGEGAARYTQAKVYFPLSGEMWRSLALDLQLEEPRTFGNYYVWDKPKRGRPKGTERGMSEATKEELMGIATDYYRMCERAREEGRTPVSLQNWCRQKGISRRKLSRAMQYWAVAKRAPK